MWGLSDGERSGEPPWAAQVPEACSRVSQRLPTPQDKQNPGGELWEGRPRAWEKAPWPSGRSDAPRR